MIGGVQLKREQSRTYTVGGASFARQSSTFGLDVAKIGRDDLAAMVRGLAVGETQRQVAAGNDQFTSEVDGRTARPLADARTRVVVTWGAELARRAMTVAETELRRAIGASLATRSGRLADVASSWEWVYVKRGAKGRAGQVTRNPAEIPSFGFADLLVLRPTDAVSYAWFANYYANNGGRLEGRRSRRDPARKPRTMGFMGATAAALRWRSEFRSFSVYAGFSQKFLPRGTRSRFGVPVLVVRLRMRGRVK